MPKRPERIYDDPDIRKFSFRSHFDLKWVLITLVLCSGMSILITYTDYGANPSQGIIVKQIIKVILLGILSSPLVKWSYMQMMEK